MRRRWMYFTLLTNGGYNGEIFIWKEKIVLFEKNESSKLKTCHKSQPTLDEQEPSVQSAVDRAKTVQVWSWRITY